MKKRFDRVYLHIGMGKTGSTAIQQDFWANADLLESAGIHYPTKTFVNKARGQRGNHSEPLLCLSHPKPETLRCNILLGKDSREKALDFGRQLRNSFERGFQQSKASELLLSAEGVPTYALAAVDGLAAWLGEWCEEICLVACLRHPVDAVSSQIQQRLKVGGALEEMYENPPFYHYATLLPRLEESFFAQKIHLYDFADAVQDKSGLANRLLCEVGLEIELPKSGAREANVSMSQEATLLLDSINRQYPLIVDGKRNPARLGAAVSWCQRVPGRKYRAPEYVYERLEAAAAPHLNWVLAGYNVKLRTRDRDSTPAPAIDQARIDRHARRLHWIARCPKPVQWVLFKLLGDPAKRQIH